MSKIGAGPHNQMMKLHTLEKTPVIQEDRDQDGVCQTNKREVFEFSFPIYLVVQDVYIDKFLDSGNVLCILEYLLTTNMRVMGKWIMLLYNIPFLLI